MSRLQGERPAEQRDACARAVVDRGLGPAEVVRLAAAGELEQGLAAFEVPPATVSSWASRLRKRRAGTVATSSAATPAAERIAALQARLINAVEHELDAVERAQRRRRKVTCSSCGEDAGVTVPEPVSGEHLRQLGRALREAAAIAPAPRAPGAAPGSGESGKPAQPGQRDADGEHAGSRTRGGLAGGILADLAGGRTAPEASPSTSPRAIESDATSHDTTRESDDGESAAQRSTTTNDGDESASTGDAVREAGEKVAAALAAMEAGAPAAG